MGKEKASRDFFDLRSQFIFYASYHNHPVNVLIHLFCIWQLLWTGLALLHFTPSLAVYEIPDCVSQGLPMFSQLKVNLPLLVTLIYVVTHTGMDPVAGGVSALLTVLLYFLTGFLVDSTAAVYGYPLLQVLIGLHIFLWIAQFVGHGLFERRAPALLDSLDQAFITAPLFVILEIFFFFGYRRNFYKEAMIEVEKNISEFRKLKSQ